MKKTLNILSFMMFLLFLIIYIFFEGHLFISTKGVLFFADSPAIENDYLDESSQSNIINYHMWVNGVNADISIRTLMWVAFSNGVSYNSNLNMARIDKTEYITIKIPREENYILSADEFFGEQTIQEIRRNNISTNNLMLVKKYFSRCFNLIKNDDFLLVDNFREATFNYTSLTAMLLHCMLHFRMVKKNFYIDMVKNKFISSKKVYWITTLGCISYILLIANVISRIVTII